MTNIECAYWDTNKTLAGCPFEKLCIIVHVGDTQKICLVFPRNSISDTNALKLDGSNLEDESWEDDAWKDKIKTTMIERLQANDCLLLNIFTERTPYETSGYAVDIQVKEGKEKEMVEHVVIIQSQGFSYV